jgi:hypothetical protein
MHSLTFMMFLLVAPGSDKLSRNQAVASFDAAGLGVRRPFARSPVRTAHASAA